MVIMSKTVSLRVSSALFDAACHTGAAMTRSGAQQLEHWAKLGQALERQGLAPDAALRMLASTDVEVSTADAMWAGKRARQRDDRAAVGKDPRAARKMLLFPVEMAQSAEVLNGNY
jgi:hypothetical protein